MRNILKLQNIHGLKKYKEYQYQFVLTDVSVKEGSMREE